MVPLSPGATTLSYDPYEALRARDYRFLLLGRVVSFFGERIASVAFGWEIYERTGSALALGYVGLVQIVPVIALTLPAGQLSDRLDRRRIVQAAQIAMAIAMAGMALVSAWQGPVPLVFLGLGLMGVARSFNNPAIRTLIPWVVPTPTLTNAVAWQTSATQLAAVIGPAVSGLLIAWLLGTAPIYLMTAICHLSSFLFIRQIRSGPPNAVAGLQTGGSIVDGIRFVAKNQVVWAAITLDLFATLFGGATALLPIYAKDVLHVGPAGLGWLNAAPSIGAITMAIVTIRFSPTRRPGLALLIGVGGFSVATTLFGISTWFPFSLAMLVLVGAFDNISVVVRATLILTRTPDELRGRVSAVESVFIGMSGQLGAFESGVVAAVFGPVVSVVSGGLGALAVVLLIAWLAPELRRMRSLSGSFEPATSGSPRRL